MGAVEAGLFVVQEAVVADLRDHYADAQTTIDATLSGIALPTLGAPGLAIAAGDGRKPPQAAAWILVETALQSELLGPAGSESRQKHKITVRVGTRQTARGASDQGTVEAQGWRIAQLLLSAAREVILGHLDRRSGFYATQGAGAVRRSSGRSSTYGMEMSFITHVRAKQPVRSAS